MSHTILPHTVVHSTSLLKQSVDAVVLGERTPFKTEGRGATFDQFPDATGLDNVQREVIKMVCIRTIFLTIY
jgi:hypothetical protein